MPLEKADAASVYERLLKNKLRTFPTGKRGAERLAPFAQPTPQAGFRFSQDSTIFATGSCFARNIEKSLRMIDANVTSSAQANLLGRDGPKASQLYNKYTVHSILNEFRWALGGQTVDHAASLIEDNKGQFYDLQVTASKELCGSREDMAAFRESYNAAFRPAGEAEVVIITLGLVECWYDTETGLYLNAAPTLPMTQHHPGRFEFHLLDYDDVLAALHEVHALLCDGKANPPKLLVTVSPVGLSSTFRDQDVLIANTYSKAVQRAAVEAFVASHDACYFPSYEYVTLTDHKFAWNNNDFRHVRQETVDRIMADVLLSYVGPSAAQQHLYTRGHATAHFENGDFEVACEMIDRFAKDNELDPGLLWVYARALRRVGRKDDCVAACNKIISKGSEFDRSAYRTALTTLKQLGKTAEMQAMADKYRDLLPDDAEFVLELLAA